MVNKSTHDAHVALHRWYAQHGRRELPWRNTADPYAIWISEVMLQQTQVSTVLARYYHPFLKKFPTVEALAKAKSEAVLKAWEGLGYYRRARNLHKAAKEVVGSSLLVLGKDLPTTKNQELITRLLSLPGVGRNTAHAVAAFAYHLPVPVMEANVKRVLARVFALRVASEKELWQKAEALLDHEHPFDYNQAMMDIGAMVCTKRAPKCGECPLAVICKGKAKPEAYPEAIKKKQTPTRRAAIIAYYDNRGRYLVRRREGEFLHGLYGFIEEPVTPQSEAIAGLDKKITPQQVRGDKLGEIRQIYSHFTLEADVYHIPGGAQKGEWKTLEQLKKLPLSKADHKVVTLLRQLQI